MPRENDGPYARQFKPAKVFGMPSLEEMARNTYMTIQNEKSEKNGNYSRVIDRNNRILDDDDALLKSIVLETSGDFKPIIRNVIVDDKHKETKSFVIEPELGGIGIFVVMLFKKNEKEFHSNVRFLPLSTFNDIIKEVSKDGFKIVIPNKKNVVKLNVTLTYSNADEPEYCTHKTFVNVEALPESEVFKVQQQLQFEIAEKVAYFTDELIRNTDIFERNASQYSESLEVLGGARVWKLIGVGLSAVCTVTAAIVTGTVGGGIAGAGGFLRAWVGWNSVSNSIDDVKISKNVEYVCYVRDSTPELPGNKIVRFLSRVNYNV